MADTLGTDAGNLTGQGGAISNTAGDTLVGTDNDGGQSYAFGPSLSRAIETGIINGDFGTPPPELDTAIDNAENALPYFSVEISASTLITAKAVADATAASGHVIRFTIPSGTAAGKYLYLTRYVAVPGSAARTWTNQPRAAWRNATGTTKTQALAEVLGQYYEGDGTTATGTLNGGSATFATISAATYAYETQCNPNTTGSIPASAAYLKIKVGVYVNVLTTSAMTVDLTEVRYDRGLIQVLLADQVNPDAYGYGVIYLNNGTMWIKANELGSSGTNPSIYLDAVTGSIAIDPKSTGTAQVLGDQTVSGTLVVSGALSDVISATDKTVITGGGTVSTGTSTGSNVLTTFVTSDANNRFKLEQNGTMSWGSGGSTVDTNLYRASGGNELKTDDDFTSTGVITGAAIVSSASITAAGAMSATNITLSGTNGVRHDTPATTTQTTSAAIWVVQSGTQYQLRRNSSSARYKTDITDADGAVLEASKRIRARHYRSTIEDEGGATRLGFIAEEIEAAGLTHAVGYDADGRPETIDPTALIAALYHRVSELEERLAALEAQ